MKCAKLRESAVELHTAFETCAQGLNHLCLAHTFRRPGQFHSRKLCHTKHALSPVFRSVLAASWCAIAISEQPFGAASPSRSPTRHVSAKPVLP